MNKETLSEKKEKTLEVVFAKLNGRPFMQEFTGWLYGNGYYSVEELMELLTREWDGAYPSEILGDDLLRDIGNFLYWMAEFACVKVYGEDYWKDSTLHIRIVVDPSYEDRSYVYVLELHTKTVLAKGCGHKTWNHNPDELEDDLQELVKQLEGSKQLVSLRMLTSC